MSSFIILIISVAFVSHSNYFTESDFFASIVVDAMNAVKRVTSKVRIRSFRFPSLSLGFDPPFFFGIEHQFIIFISTVTAKVTLVESKSRYFVFSKFSHMIDS